MPSSDDRSRADAKFARFTEHDVALTTMIASRIAPGSSNDQIVEAVPVQVTCAPHRIAGQVEEINPVEPEPRAAIQRGQVQGRSETTRLPEHHVTLTAVGGTRVATVSPNDQIVEAVPVHITCVAHGPTGFVARINAVESKAVAAIQHRQAERCLYFQRGGTLRVDLEHVASNSFTDLFSPAGSNVNEIVQVAANDQCVRVTADVQHFAHIQVSVCWHQVR